MTDNNQRVNEQAFDKWFQASGFTKYKESMWAAWQARGAMEQAAPEAPAAASVKPEQPLWDENGEPWNLAAEAVDYQRYLESVAAQQSTKEKQHG